MKKIHVTVALYLSDDADVDQVVAEMDYHFEYEDQIRNTEVIDVEVDFDSSDSEAAESDWSHVENPAVLRVLNGSQNYNDLHQALYATESMIHIDPEVDAEITRLWVAAEADLANDHDMIVDDLVVENLKKIWTLLKPE